MGAGHRQRAVSTNSVQVFRAQEQSGAMDALSLSSFNTAYQRSRVHGRKYA